MKRFLLVATLFSGIEHAVASVDNFDLNMTGKLPSAWFCGATGGGSPKWTVEADASAPSRPNVLKQSGTALFPWCVKNDIAMTDGSVQVKFKPVAGHEDQAGGVIWRWKDGDNYYVARANALENNVALYHTTNGSRTTIEYRDAPVSSNQWHILRVDFKGAAIRVALDGKVYIDTQDTHIIGAGKVGVWTKADSVTLFDDFDAITQKAK